MAEVLSQNEIEALLASMTTVEDESDVNPAVEERMAVSASAGTIAHSRPADGKVFLPLHKRRRAAASQALSNALRVGARAAVSYELYDFRRPDKLSKENLRSLQVLHETFSGYFASSLAGYLRAQVQVEVVSVDQVPYDEYMKSMSASLLNILNVSPLGGQAIFEIDFGILFSMLDRLLGGKGSAGKIMRDLTDIEKVLSSNVIELALSEMKTAWANVNPLDFDVASMETGSQFVQIVPGNDTVVLILFEIRMGDHQGAMSLCIPYLLIKPILSKLSAQRWLTNPSKKPSALFTRQLAQRLHTTRVPCVARLGTASLTVQDMADLQVGQVLPMQVATDAASGQPGRIGSVDLVIGSEVKFRGKTGLRGKNLAVQIEEVVSPPAELVSHREVS